ncbi:hypothetical protein BKA70DRAFT_692097 [Coprinopsis sp. MPI-PUGE-AT-0042]|nr:hypothetical protein BKA70DRAFT_692097 [Coprinopsis sp. MPI-PUGE-AT-0042]
MASTHGLRLHPLSPTAHNNVFQPYLHQNIVPPPSLPPLVSKYLAELSRTIEGLDSAKKEKRAHLERERTSYAGTSPIRSVPPELWGIIFGYALGAEPFGATERQTYTRLRSVCSSWRRVATATPGLCTGLEIDIEKWLGYRILASHDLEELLEAFKDYIAPWMAILSCTSPYQLRLSSEPEFYGQTRFLKDPEREAIVTYLLTRPTNSISLSMSSSDIFWLMVESMACYPSIASLNLNLFLKISPDLLSLPKRFPNLENLVVQSKFTLVDMPGLQGNLQSLTLLDLDAFSGEFAELLEGLPCLRELKIDSREMTTPSSDAPRLAAPIIHPTLEVIAIGGEDLIFLLEYLAAPSLKFFGIHAWGWHDEDHTLVDIATLFLQRSRPADIAVSLKGDFRSSFFNPFTQILPGGTRLHLAGDVNIRDDEDEDDHWRTTNSVLFRSGTPREIFCHDLRWLREGVSLAPQNPSINIFMPNDPCNEELRIDLERGGYEVNVCSQYDMGRMIRAMFPRMTIKWDIRDEFS